ncbi:MAG: ribbon-helix-helix protein, CopG family [Leptolyngbyaceae cyanobacterium]
MARDKTFRVRLTQQEFDKLERNDRDLGISSAELIRDYIKRLPNLPISGVSNPHQQA